MVEDEPSSAPPPSTRSGQRAPHQRRGLLSAIFREAAPLDLRIVGRVLIHAVIVGAAAGLMACVLYYLLEVVQAFVIDHLTGYQSLRAAGEFEEFGGVKADSPRPWLLWILPAIGAFLASLIVHRFAPECMGAGADATIRAFHQKVSEVRRRVITIKPLATVLTLSFGGAGGREGPMMQIGGAIGSTIGRYLNVSQRERRILLISGVAAGTSAIFRTPLGAALLAVELLYRDDFESDALDPAVLASVVGYSVFISVFGDATLFDTAAKYPFVIRHLPLYAVLTLVLAAAGRLFVRCLRQVEGLSKDWPPLWSPALGGLVVGLLGTGVALIGDPEVAMGIIGGGYGAAQAAITGAPWLGEGGAAIAILALLAAGKMLAASFTIGTGGSAGAFAPSIVIGALLGGAFGRTMQLLFDDPAIQPGAFALVGMGTLFGGIAHAPLGALVMVCELAGSYDLLVPLMLAEGIAFVAMRKTSLYKAQLPTRQDSPAHPPRVLEVLGKLTVAEVMTARRDFSQFTSGTPIRAVMEAVSNNTWQDVFPVVDDDTGRIQGMITPDLLRLVAAERELEVFLVAADTMQEPVTVQPGDNLGRASEIMWTHGLRELLVADEDGQIVGFLDEAEIGQIYLGHLG
ncbi:MAG: chloride channel protein [Polyangiaceae bacterium]